MAEQLWMKVAKLYWLDPKFDGLGVSHEALYMRLLGYTRHFETDAFIPAAAIAYCGRRIYNRDKVLADLVEHGLIEVSTAEGMPYRFPNAWHNYSAMKVNNAGQGAARAGGREDKNRRSLYNSGSSSLAQGPVRMIHGVPHKHIAGSGWVKVSDGTGTEHDAAQEYGQSAEGTAVPDE